MVYNSFCCLFAEKNANKDLLASIQLITNEKKPFNALYLAALRNDLDPESTYRSCLHGSGKW
jgi:hypothetical protein